jgi:hypothetical protein
VVKWIDLHVGDIGAPMSSPNYPIKSVQITGTWGGATVVIEGSNMPSAPTYDGLHNPWYGALSINADALRGILENCYWVRPRVVDGGATTDLDVYLLCVTER